MKQLTHFLVIPFLVAMIVSCGTKSSKTEASKPTSEAGDSVVPISDDSLIAQTTREILTLFKNKQYDKIGKYVHPEQGVRFSPYCYIDPKIDVVLHQRTFQDWVKTNDPKKPIEWGAFDGTGDPIVMPFDKYAGRFVYDADFLNAEQTLINNSKGFSNTIDNREEIYKDKPFTCSWFSGFDPQYEGMDWRSLHLIYEIEDGKAWLIGVIHSEWTT